MILSYLILWWSVNAAYFLFETYRPRTPKPDEVEAMTALEDFRDEIAHLNGAAFAKVAIAGFIGLPALVFVVLRRRMGWRKK